MPLPDDGMDGDAASTDDRSSTVSSVRKAFSILDLFSVERPSYSADEIIVALGCSRPQAYRYIRDLSQAGFLVRSASTYRLGARPIELDYIVRQSDPLLHAALPTMREIRDHSGCDVMLTGLVGDRIITIHHERGIDPTTVSYSRGRVMPRFRGAGSKAIVAAMPLAQQRAFFAQHHTSELASPLGDTWDSARAALKDIRRRGVAVSDGELDPENVGVAVSIALEGPGTFASLVLVFGAARYRTSAPASITELIIAAAKQIEVAVNAAPLPKIKPLN